MSGKFFMKNNLRAARLTVPFMSFVAAVMLATPLHAASISWRVLPPQTGDWSTATNWNGGLPTSTSTAYIVNGGTATVTTVNATCGDLALGGSAGSGAVSMTSGSLSTGNEYIGGNGAGNFTQSGGTNSMVWFYLGYNPSGQTTHLGNGTYELSGSGLLSVASLAGEYIGYSGTGSFTQSGGTNLISFIDRGISNPGNLTLGYLGGSGTYQLSGSGLLSTGSEYIGDIGTGSFTQSGGTNSVSQEMDLGSTVSGSLGSTFSGSYSLTGSGLLSSNSEYIGKGGTASFTQSGGTNSMVLLYLGYTPSGQTTHLGNGTYDLSGSGLLSVASLAGEYVGYSGTGSFTQSGGTNSISSIYRGISNPGNLTLGYDGGSGTYQLSGSGLLSTGSEYIGDSGTGSFTQSGGTNSVSVPLPGYGFYLGYGQSTTGTYNLRNGILTCQSSPNPSVRVEYIGYSGIGTFTQSGGTNSVGILTLAANSGSSGRYDLIGGLLSLSGLSQGTGTATFNFGGGTFQAASSFSTGVPITLTTSGSNAVFDTSGNTLTFTGVLSGSGGMTKTGLGTLILTGSNTYSDSTTINQGNLAVNGSLVSPVTINSGGFLSGTGSLASVTVNAGGHLSPGNSPGILNLSGDLILASGAMLDYELDTPGTSDQTKLSGNLALNGQQFTDFNFMPSPNFGPGTYDLIDFGSKTGDLGANTSGVVGVYDATLSVQGNELVLNVVPEPSTVSLLGWAFFAGVVYLWRRGAKALR